VEPAEIVEMNNRIGLLESKEKEEIRRILADITRELAEITEELSANQEILTTLDYHYACGCLGMALDSVTPEIISENKIHLNGARHPLLLLRYENKNDVIPMTLTVGDDFNTLVISGPNAGGKTVALKTVGLLCLMVQYGLPVPVEDGSQFPVINRISAEIGDPQSIEDDLSTFSAKLLNYRSFLEDPGEFDLVLVDEIASGTDPNEGAALSAAIIEYLSRKNVLTVVTTHHGGLKIFANQSEKIENASLAFDEKIFKPSYELIVGVPGSSYALELAEKIGIPDMIIESTREYIGENRLKVEDFIKDLENRIGKYKENNEIVEKKKKKLDELIEEYSGKKKSR